MWLLRKDLTFPGNLTTKSRGSKNRRSFPWVLKMLQLHLGVPACSQSFVLMAPSGLGAPASGVAQPSVLGSLKMVCVCACVCTCLAAQSCQTLCNSMDSSSPGSSVHGDSPGKNTGVGCHGLLQAVYMCICTYTSV